MIDETSFIERALKSYDNPNCLDIGEFESDLLRFSYIKKALTVYDQTKEINERLVLNNIIVCFNLFGKDAILFLMFKVSKNHWKYLFPFLYFLNRVPEYIIEYDIHPTSLELDMNILLKLKALLKWQE